MRQCELTFKSAAALEEVLQDTASLHTLRLGWNTLGVKGKPVANQVLCAPYMSCQVLVATGGYWNPGWLENSHS